LREDHSAEVLKTLELGEDRPRMYFYGRGTWEIVDGTKVKLSAKTKEKNCGNGYSSIERAEKEPFVDVTFELGKSLISKSFCMDSGYSNSWQSVQTIN
jgi:hypothetical protein